jgi:hypothetical protein
MHYPNPEFGYRILLHSFQDDLKLCGRCALQQSKEPGNEIHGWSWHILSRVGPEEPSNTGLQKAAGDGQGGRPGTFR